MISKQINQEKVNEAYARWENRDKHYSFNCWGTTLYALDKVDELYWVDCEEITEFINRNTFTVIGEDSIKSGDILVMYEYADDFYSTDYDEDTWEEMLDKDGMWIIHTAVFITPTKLFHKCGGGIAEFTDIQGVLNSYSYNRYEVRRLDNYKK